MNLLYLSMLSLTIPNENCNVKLVDDCKIIENITTISRNAK